MQSSDALCSLSVGANYCNPKWGLMRVGLGEGGKANRASQAFSRRALADAFFSVSGMGRADACTHPRERVYLPLSLVVLSPKDQGGGRGGRIRRESFHPRPCPDNLFTTYSGRQRRDGPCRCRGGWGPGYLVSAPVPPGVKPPGQHISGRQRATWPAAAFHFENETTRERVRTRPVPATGCDSQGVDTTP